MNFHVAGDNYDRFLASVMQRVEFLGRDGNMVSSRPGDLGRLPVLALMAASAVFGLSLAYAAARHEAAWAGPLFWIAYLLICLPITLRLLGSEAQRGERIGLVLILGTCLYLVKVLRDPAGFVFYDELLHWRSAEDILSSGRLFQENPLLLVSPLYPALEVVTAAVAQVGVVDIFTAGLLVVAVARIACAMALFLFFEAVSNSSLIGALAAALYMANPKFTFFNVLYSYESLALPLLVLILLTVAWKERMPDRNRLGSTVVGLLAIGAIVTAHHLTSYSLVLILLVWGAIRLVTRHEVGDGRGALSLGIIAAVAALTWLLFVATTTLSYLGGPLVNAVLRLGQVVSGEEPGRELFRAATGEVAPFAERVTGIAFVAVVLVGLLIGLVGVWRKYRHVSGLLLAVIALGFPISLALRVTAPGADVAGRSWSFVFLGVAFVLAVAARRIRAWIPDERQWRTTLAVPLGVLFAGAVILGTATWSRLPGPYRVGADSRSVNPESVAAAEWARRVLGPDNRLAADRVNRVLMGSYGAQHIVHGHGTGVGQWRVFLSTQLGAMEDRILRRGQVAYLLIDRRLARELPLVGHYYERGEDLGIRGGRPLDLATLGKFDDVRNVSRIFDSGNIQLYDVRGRIGPS